MAIICWPMLRARRPGLRTSGSPLKYLTEPELPRYVRIEEQHKARSKKGHEKTESVPRPFKLRSRAACALERQPICQSSLLEVRPPAWLVSSSESITDWRRQKVSVLLSSLRAACRNGLPSVRPAVSGSRRAARQYPSRSQQHPSLTLPPAPFSTFDLPYRSPLPRVWPRDCLRWPLHVASTRNMQSSVLRLVIRYSRWGL